MLPNASSERSVQHCQHLHHAAQQQEEDDDVPATTGRHTAPAAAHAPERLRPKTCMRRTRYAQRIMRRDEARHRVEGARMGRRAAVCVRHVTGATQRRKASVGHSGSVRCADYRGRDGTRGEVKVGWRAASGRLAVICVRRTSSRATRCHKAAPSSPLSQLSALRPRRCSSAGSSSRAPFLFL